ncbi:MAG: fasciclin domain-containing protein [Paracoccaceae bacterium]
MSLDIVRAPLALLLAFGAAPALAQDSALGTGDGPSRVGAERGVGDIEDDVVEVADEAEGVDTFIAGLEALGLADRLRGVEGPFTLLAPTDAAFEALPDETLRGLLLEENDDRLEAIVSNHVIEGRLSAEDLARMDEVETLWGEDYVPEAEDGRLMLGGAQVVTRDLDAANGIVHVIDRVIEP